MGKYKVIGDISGIVYQLESQLIIREKIKKSKGLRFLTIE